MTRPLRLSRPVRDRREQQSRTLTRKGSLLFKQHLHFYGSLPPISCADSLSLLCVRAMAVPIALAPLSCVFAYVRYGLCNRRLAVACALREPLLLNKTPQKKIPPHCSFERYGGNFANFMDLSNGAIGFYSSTANLSRSPTAFWRILRASEASTSPLPSTSAIFLVSSSRFLEPTNA